MWEWKAKNEKEKWKRKQTDEEKNIKMRNGRRQGEG